MKRSSLCRWLYVVAAMAICFPAFASDWNQWRGPGRNGQLSNFKSPTAWPAQLTKRWSLNVGEGHSSPIIVGNRAYVLVRQGEQELTYCLELDSGKTVWVDKVNAPFDSVIFPARRLGKSPRSTPLFHEGKLYTIGVNGLMTCFNSANGRILWRRDFVRMFSIPMPICGASLSPLVDGKKIYVHVGHDNQGAFLALDKDTGNTIWEWRGEGPGYTSPMMANIGGTRQIITASHNMWIGISPETGRLLWSLPVRQNMFNHNSITPIIVGDTVICGANQRPTFAMRLKQNGTNWGIERVWEQRQVTMSTSSPILSGNTLYAVTEKRRGQVVMMSLDSGKILWECPGNKGEHVTLYDAGNVVVAFTISGDLFIYQKMRDQLKEVARYQVADGAMWASPAFSGNRVLVKGAETLTLWEIPRS